MRRHLAAIAAVVAASVAALVFATPANSVTDCETALAQATQLEAVLDNNTTDGARRRVRLESDLRNFIADVRGGCPTPSPTTTTAQGG